MSKWKCDICNSEFNNFHAERLENKIYCPLCFYKREFNRLQQEKEDLIKWLEEKKTYHRKNPSWEYNGYQLVEMYDEILNKLKGDDKEC